MIYETLTFIVIGKKNKALLDLFINSEHEKSEDSFIWEDISEEYQKENNVDFSTLSSDEIIKNIKLKYGEKIKIFKYSEKEILNDQDVAIFLNKKGNFNNIKKFKVNHLYINYQMSLDQDSFLTKTKICLNNVQKRNIDFYNMGEVNINYQLKKYDLYHYLKNKLNLADYDKFKRYLLDNHADVFTVWDEYKILELNLEDYCLFSAVEDFYPDFYFNYEGKLKIIYSKDVLKMVENIKEFVKDINQTPDKERLTIYRYSE